MSTKENLRPGYGVLYESNRLKGHMMPDLDTDDDPVPGEIVDREVKEHGSVVYTVSPETEWWWDECPDEAEEDRVWPDEIVAVTEFKTPSERLEEIEAEVGD